MKYFSSYSKRTLFFIGVFTVFFTTLFFIKATIFLDTDFGWHIRLSELVTEQGIERIEPFSYAMPSHLYVDHEWLVHTFLFPLYTSVGYGGLALLLTAILFSLCLFYLKTTPKYRVLPLILLLSVFILRFGIRVQVISWVFMFFLFWVVMSKDRWQVYRWLIPALFYYLG